MREESQANGNEEVMKFCDRGTHKMLRNPEERQTFITCVNEG